MSKARHTITRTKTQKNKAPSELSETSSSQKGKHVSEEERYCLIAEAAYYRAERRGFIGGDPVADWLEAEAEIDRRVRAG
jgi:Protein of unknown function (DUF2934)